MDATAMTQGAAELFHILDEQAALFQEWLVLEKKKKEALWARDRAALEAAIQEQSGMLRTLDGLEGRRRRLAARLTGGPDEPTLKEVAEALPPPLRGECLLRGERLTARMAEVQQANELGLALLQQAAAHNQALLSALVGEATVSGIYDPSGARPGSGTGGVPAQSYRIDRHV